MNLRIFNDYSTQSRATADLIAAFLMGKPDALVCLASGHSPKGVFECLQDDVKNGRLDLRTVTFVSLDEWVGIPARQKGSCRAMMDEDLFIPLQIPESNIIFFDGMSSNLQEEVDRINKVVSGNGGFDIMLVGVGTNGHLAMNEPGASFGMDAHVSKLAEETKLVGQKYFAAETKLDRGITVGLNQFKTARLPILMANGHKKSGIMKKILASPATEALPGSIIHTIPAAYVMLDVEAYG